MSSNIYPLLKHPKWNQADKALCRPLFPELVSEQMPLVAFGYDHSYSFDFLPRKSVSEDDRFAFEHETINGLKSIELPGWEFNGPFLACTGSYYCAERILDHTFLLEAHQMLATETIMVATPRRGLVVAMNAQGLKSEKAQFVDLVTGQYQNSQHPISPILFVIENGIAVDSLDGIGFDDPEQAQVTTIVENDVCFIFGSGLNRYHVMRVVMQEFLQIYARGDCVAYRLVIHGLSESDRELFMAHLTNVANDVSRRHGYGQAVFK